MGLLGLTKGYNRSQLLHAANRARAKKQRKKAIRLYRQIIAMEPANSELHARLAPLLAETHQYFDAWESFKIVGNAFSQNKNPEKEVAVYRAAAKAFPGEIDVWRALAEAERARGRLQAAVNALVEGSKHFRSRELQPKAIHLLRRAREIEAWSYEAVFDLARLLVKADQKVESSWLLAGLAERTRGSQLRRVCAAQFRRAPTLTNAWRWLRAGGQAPPAPRGAPRASAQRLRVRQVRGSRRAIPLDEAEHPGE